MPTDIDVQAGGLEDISAQHTIHNPKNVASTHVPEYPHEKDFAGNEVTVVGSNIEYADYVLPTDDELEGPNKLRRISAPIPWSVYTIAFVELCERFSYYGTQVVCESCLPYSHDVVCLCS